ncbi:MAG TPA: hypothetical protein VE398_15965 [Acidobacteriota bacterium]|nr:hypothetical protein [Acidobacteriota bacterium]
MNLEGKWKAIFIGALITGLTPFVPVLNLACCITPIIGAIVAVAVYRASEPPPVLSTNDGLVLGAMSGLVGTGIYAVLVVPLVLFVGNLLGGIIGSFVPSLAELPPNVRPMLEGIFSNVANLIGFILAIKIIGQLAFSLLFGILGGLLGIAILRRPRSQHS